jgi:ABC-type sugar transport system ATPase subunit
MTELLEVDGVTKQFFGVTALENVSLTLKAGTVHAVLGENGAGKSTLMKLIAGVHQPTSGGLRLKGKSVRLSSAEEARDRGISTVFQEFILLPNLSVAENLFLGREPRNKLGMLDRKRMHEDSRTALDGLGVNLDPARLTSTLSVAEQQMVEIAKGVMREADIFVLDEPTAALGDKEAERLFALVRQLRSQGKGVLYVSHRLPEIFDLSDEITVLKDSKLVGNYRTANLTPDQLINAMVGRPLEDLFPPKSDPNKALDEAVAVDRVEVKGLSGVANFSVKRGEILGLAGLEGQGQTSITRSIFGDRQIIGGSIRLAGHDGAIRNPQDAVRLRIGLIPEDRKAEGLFLELSVDDNIAASMLAGAPFWRRAWRDLSAVKDQVASLAIRLATIRQPIKSLSGGNQQKALLARWLVRGVDVLICEEPTRGVDIGAKGEIYRLLRELADSGVAVVVTSREMPEVLGLCDRIIVFREGATVATFRASEATEDRIMHAAIYGEAA